jgi:hypothetical protein
VDRLGEQLGLGARHPDAGVAAGAVPRRPAAIPTLAAAGLGNCGVGAGLARRVDVAPYDQRCAIAAEPLGLSGAAGVLLEQTLLKLFVGLPVAAVAAAVSLIVRFRGARGVERQQLKWLAYAMGVLMVAPVVQDSWLGGWAAAAADSALFAIPAAIGVAILRYRLYNMDRLINRTLVYGLLTALLGGVYSGAVLVMGQVLGGVGRDPPSWAMAGVTLAVAALFQPARRRIQALVDRRFNRRKYDAANTVEAFSTRLRDEVDLEALSAELLTVVDQTMQPTTASLWLRPPPQAAPASKGPRLDAP